MAIVRYVLAKLKPGVSPEEYERFEREVDYVVAGQLPDAGRWTLDAGVAPG
jgi:hypothetical protein